MSVGTRGLLWRQFSEGRRLDVHNGRRTDGVTRHHTHSDQPVDCTNISVNPGRAGHESLYHAYDVATSTFNGPASRRLTARNESRQRAADILLPYPELSTSVFRACPTLFWLQVELSRMQPPSLESRWSGKPFRMVAGPRFRDTGDGSATQGGRT